MSTLYVDNLQPNLGSQVEIPDLKPLAGSVVQVQFLSLNTTAYDDITLTSSSSGVEIFSSVFTTLYDNSSLYLIVDSGQTKKTISLSNAKFDARVDGVSTTKQRVENHNFYGVTQGSDFRFYSNHTAFFDNVGAAGSKTISVLGGTFLDGAGSIIFNFQGSSDSGRRRCQVTVMEIAQ